ncbi:MAG TPA: aldolase catalytic domain-containing protein [Verrucomicrobiae bacterium]|nr:aldolase catalytic domain-containing protein [Verrucomicrobiae bacterium]
MEMKDNPADSGWVGFRPQIKVLDCTIRDGGLMNNSRFEDGVVSAVYRACVEGGIDYMEIGYRNSRKIFSPDHYGAWRFSHEDDIRRIVGDNPTNLKLAVMSDAEKSDYKTETPPKSESVVDLIRVACYIHQIPLALDMIKDAHDKGYETTINIMAASVIQERELDEALALVADSETQGVYLVDSFGHFYSEQIRYLIIKYMSYLRPMGKAVGIHAHNNLQLAYANTIEAIVLGANMVDATMAGLGRGAGNCPMELLIGFLHNPKYKLRPVLDCVENHIEPMRKSLKWGFDLPYLITGLLNRHPRSAMKFNEAEVRGDILDFYDKALAGE